VGLLGGQDGRGGCTPCFGGIYTARKDGCVSGHVSCWSFSDLAYERNFFCRRDGQGWTALHYVAAAGDEFVDVASLLLAFGASPAGGGVSEGLSLETPFALASAGSHTFMARLLACAVTPGLNTERPLLEAAAADVALASANQDFEDEKDAFLRAAATNDWFGALLYRVTLHSRFLMQKPTVPRSSGCCRTRQTALRATATGTRRCTLWVMLSLPQK
jgi:hypothetical protein